jgi:hypothetical protein
VKLHRRNLSPPFSGQKKFKQARNQQDVGGKNPRIKNVAGYSFNLVQGHRTQYAGKYMDCIFTPDYDAFTPPSRLLYFKVIK